MTASIRASIAASYYCVPDYILYYLTGSLGVGVWHGEGADELGFRGIVLPEALQAAYDGFSADGVKQLVQLQEHEGKDRQRAFDLTFSAPKSLSVLWSALGSAERHRIEELVMEAAKKAIDYINKNALFTRRGKHGSRFEKAKIVSALIPHGTSRALDPQLHVHAIILSICLRSDRTSGTIRSKNLYQHKMAAGAVFRLELAFLLLKELGLLSSPDPDSPWSFVVNGVSPELCHEQSKRRQAIEQLAKEEGWTSPKVMAELAIATRKAKGRVNLKECFANWQETAAKYGLTREAANELFTQGQQRVGELSCEAVVDGRRDDILSLAVDEAVNSIAQCESYFPERKVVQEASALVQGKGFSADQVLDAVKQKLGGFENYVEYHKDFEYRYYSTKENIAAEKELIERVTKGRESTRLLATEASVERAIKKEEQLLSRALGTKAELTDDQKKSLNHTALDAGDVKLVQGPAGAGKTLVLNAAHRAWKESGLHVLGTSITGRAAQGLQKTTGIPSVTVASLLHALRPELSPEDARRLFGQQLKSAIYAEKYEAKRAGEWMKNPVRQMFREIGRTIKNAFQQTEARPEIKLTNKSVLVVDEAAMLSTKAWLALKQECDKEGAKLVAVGDRMQLPPIEAGGPFWSLARIVGCEALNTIVRQRHAWMRGATEHIIADRPLEALHAYAKHDAVVLSKHKNAAIEKLVANYSQIRSQDLPKVAALVSTNQESRSINQAMQQKRKAAKELGLASLKLPNGERVYTGDIVVMRHNDYHIGVRNGVRGTVIGIERPRGITGPGALQIQLHGETQSGLLSWRPKVVTIDLKDYEKVQLGYAITTHMAQGITLDKSHVLLGDSMQSKNMAYTQLTRHREECTIYATEAEYGDSLEVIAKSISRSVEKDMALDYRLKLQEREREAERQSQLEQDGYDQSLSIF